MRAVRVRRAVDGDEATLRSLRLNALGDTPDAFGSTLELELARTTSDWHRWITPNPTFLLETSGGEAAGLVAGAPDEIDADAVQLQAMWVRPSSRATGGADLLVESVIAWARDEHAAIILLWVTQGNASANRLYERNGFAFTGQQWIRERDACIELEMLHRL